MAKESKLNSAQPKVRMVPVEMSDAEERLARAFDLILRAAARAEEQPSREGTAGQKVPHDER